MRCDECSFWDQWDERQPARVECSPEIVAVFPEAVGTTVANPDHLGWCRRFPPCFYRKSEDKTCHPHTEGDDWCGEFQPKEQMPQITLPELLDCSDVAHVLGILPSGKRVREIMRKLGAFEVTKGELRITAERLAKWITEILPKEPEVTSDAVGERTWQGIANPALAKHIPPEPPEVTS